jgi:hypothetical protein
MAMFVVRRDEGEQLGRSCGSFDIQCGGMYGLVYSARCVG